MSSEVVFYQKVMERRVQLTDAAHKSFKARAVLYNNAAQTYGESLGIEGVPIIKLEMNSSEDEIQEALVNLEMFMEGLKARHLFTLEPSLQLASVQLNGEWRSKATTLVSHIREIVGNAKMDEGLREPILRSLNQLQNEIDRNRTRLDVVSNAWLQITTAIGNGAENLEQAVKLVERLTKALSKAKRHEIEAEDLPSLPPPDELSDEDDA